MLHLLFAFWTFAMAAGKSRSAKAALRDKGQANDGDAKAQYRYAKRLFKGFGVAEDLSKAAKYYKKAVDQGYKRAQVVYGHCCVSVQGVPQDMAKAAQYYELAADQGNSQGQVQLGHCLIYGEGIAQDSAKRLSITNWQLTKGILRVRYSSAIV
jgi:hypothetical protein